MYLSFERKEGTDMNWTKEMVEERIAEFIKEKGYFPHPKDFKENTNLPSRETIRRKVGMYPVEYCKMKYPELCTKEYTDRLPKDYQTEHAKIILKLDEMVEQNQRIPTMEELTGENGIPSYWEVKKYVGSLNKLAEERYSQYCTKQYRQDISLKNKDNRERIIEQLDRFVKKNNRMPTKKDLGHENNMPTYSEIRQHFMSLKCLMLERYSELQVVYDKEMILESVKEFTEIHGRYPKYKDMGGTMPSIRLVEKTFGTFQNLLDEYKKIDSEDVGQEEECIISMMGM